MKSALYLFLLAGAMLVSCGGNTPSSQQSAGSSAEASSAVSSATYLDWVADNKIVIDLFSVGDARFAYGNAALAQESNTLDLDASASLTCSTQLTKDKTYNFVFVTEATTGTGFNAGAALYAGIEGDRLSDFLKDNDDLNGKVRAYIAISFGDTVSWAKGKNAAMDAKIQSLVEAAK
jgi:hypothetical protein